MTIRGGTFKAAMHAGATQYGLFCCLPTFQTVEALAGSGFGFFIFDVEHSPMSPGDVHVALTALATSAAASVVRISANDPVAFKYFLDIGADAIMVPNIESAAMADLAVRHMRYPPEGIRGVGGSMRSTDYGRNSAQYYAGANAQSCLVVQIESPAGLAHLDEICAVEGVDVVFFGPNDYAAQTGHLGSPAHPDVVAALTDGAKRARAHGKATGILIGEAQVDHFLAAGVQMIAVGSEIGIMARTADALAKRMNDKTPSGG